MVEEPEQEDPGPYDDAQDGNLSQDEQEENVSSYHETFLLVRCILSGARAL